MWTLLCLIIYFILTNILIFGMQEGSWVDCLLLRCIQKLTWEQRIKQSCLRKGVGIISHDIEETQWFLTKQLLKEIHNLLMNQKLKETYYTLMNQSQKEIQNILMNQDGEEVQAMIMSYKL